MRTVSRIEVRPAQEMRAGHVVRYSEGASGESVALAHAISRDTSFVFGVVRGRSGNVVTYLDGALVDGSPVPVAEVITSGEIELAPDEWQRVIEGGASELEPTRSYYVSDACPGAITTRPGAWVAEVGIAMSPTVLLVRPFAPYRNLLGLEVESVWQVDHLIAMVFTDRSQQIWEAVWTREYVDGAVPAVWIGSIALDNFRGKLTAINESTQTPDYIDIIWTSHRLRRFQTVGGGMNVDICAQLAANDPRERDGRRLLVELQEYGFLYRRDDLVMEGAGWTEITDTKFHIPGRSAGTASLRSVDPQK